MWTEAEIQSLPDDGYIHEVVGGELVMSPKNNFFHGRICTRILVALETFNRAHRLGAVLDSSTGFWMFNRNLRAPDVSFVTKNRMELLGFRPSDKRFFSGAPDLAVEVLSPNNARDEVDRRLRDFFGSGTQIAWVVNPDQECVEICHSLEKRQLLGPAGFLNGEQLLPSFRYSISDLFKEWDWDDSSK